MQTAEPGPDLMSTAVIAALPVAANGHLGNLGLIFISAHTTLRTLEGLTHIARHLVEAVERVRRDEIREKWPEYKALMYKTRFIWRKNPLNLIWRKNPLNRTEGRARRAGERERLELEINRAYMLKELFRQIWVYRRAGWVKRYLNNKAELVIRKVYRFRAANNHIRNLYHCLSEIPLSQTVHTIV